MQNNVENYRRLMYIGIIGFKDIALNGRICPNINFGYNECMEITFVQDVGCVTENFFAVQFALMQPARYINELWD